MPSSSDFLNTPALKSEICEKEAIKLYQNGLAADKIGKILGCSGSTVKRILKKNKIDIRNPGEYNKTFTPEQRLKVIELYKQGLHMPQIASMFNVSSTAIRRILKKNKIDIRKISEYKRKINDEQEMQIVELYKKGTKVEKILADFSISRALLMRIVKKHKVNRIADRSQYKKRPSSFLEQQKDKIIKLYQQDVSINKIASKYMTTNFKIQRILKLSKIEIRPPSYYHNQLLSKSQEIIALYNKGATVVYLAENFNTQPRKIENILKNNNVEINRVIIKKPYMNLISDETRTQIINLYKRGLSKKDIAINLYVSVSSVTGILKNNENNSIKPVITKVKNIPEKKVVKEIIENTGSKPNLETLKQDIEKKSAKEVSKSDKVKANNKKSAKEKVTTILGIKVVSKVLQ